MVFGVIGIPTVNIETASFKRNTCLNQTRQHTLLQWKLGKVMETFPGKTADAARRLNVSRSVVQRLWDQYQSEDSVSRRPVPGRP
ncbi:hypothetical protein TNCV_1548641 [Trichonephila clavipes]|nr:hypothetical protein TNCV_1548641 [Trichonephila clavipes]